MSVFRFFAQTSPGLEEILISELRQLSIKGRLRGDIAHVQFQASYEDLFKVLHESRTIESLKIQIGNEIQARSEDELQKNILKLPWAAFLPVENMHTYNQPKILAKSYRSNLYHEKLIVTIIERQLNLLQTRRDYKSINRMASSVKNPSLQREIAHRKRIVDSHKAEIISNRAALQEAATSQSLQVQSGHGSAVDNIEKKNSDLAERQSLPDIHAYLVKDRACLLMKLHLDSLHKHAIKEKVGWAPIKEGIVAGSLISMDFKQRFGKHLRIWDPFCGSGSIVLELISMMFATRIREKFDFFFLKNFPEQKYSEYLATDSVDTNNLSKFKDISIIASDISNEAIQYSVENFHSSGLHAALNTFLEKQSAASIQEDAQVEEQQQPKQVETKLDQEHEEKESQEDSHFPISSERNARIKNKSAHEKEEEVRKQEGDGETDISLPRKYKELDQSRLDQLAPFYIQEQYCENRVRFIRSDFEALSRVMDLNGFTIITNLPYGLRSKEHISDAVLISAFKRFAKTIRKNLSKLQDVFIYSTVHEKYHRDHFIHLSNMVWRVKQKYSLGGLEIGLFQLDIEASKLSQNYQVIDEVAQEMQEKRMRILERKITVSKTSEEDAALSQSIREIIGDRAVITQMDAKEAREFHKEEEMRMNKVRLGKAASIEEPIVKALTSEQTQTPRQIKSIAQRKKVEYAKALRLRELMHKDTQVQNLNQKELERRVSLKRDRVSKDFLRSVMESVGVEDKEDALAQIQDKLDERAQKKRAVNEEKQEKKNKVGSGTHNKWF